MSLKPNFLITIDTEGDNLWSSPHSITTRNARFLPRFQDLCERHGFKPTYLTNYEMAIDPFFIQFGRRVVQDGTGEIGMHLHAWNSPPLVPLTRDDFRYCPYLVEYPTDIMEQKIAFMTNLLEDLFAVKMVSHRAGRWAIDERYASMLVKHGYTVDSSVTPGISWQHHRGNPSGNGGSDFSRFPKSEYLLDLSDLSREGTSSLLELPMTIVTSPYRKHLPWVHRRDLAGKIVNKLAPARWLRPNGKNRSAMLAIVRQASLQQLPYVQFMLHSSELMPGGSPTFRDGGSIENLYDCLECLFDEARRHFAGVTLAEYRHQYGQQRAKAVEPHKEHAQPT